MFSIFKRRSPEPRPLSANDRIRSFWVWFQEVAPAFLKTIDEGRCGDLTEVTSRKVDELFPGFGWVYGPGANGTGHSFTLTGEGVENRQLLALHWLSLAPVIEGWTFHAARQPGEVNSSIRMDSLEIHAKEIWISPVVDEEEERIDLTVWHPLWPELDKNRQWTVVFLFLDEALGEYGTKWWIGQIRLENDRLADSFPLAELPGYVEDIAASRGWEKHPPGETYSLLKIEPSEETFPRHDLITLSTAAIHLFHDHREAKGRMEDPFKGTGADYVYISFKKEFLAQGEEVAHRGSVEDALDAALRSGASGRCIGGGFGLRLAYVDLLIFDGKKSIKVILQTLKSLGLPKGTRIEYFAQEKRDQVVML